MRQPGFKAVCGACAGLLGLIVLGAGAGDAMAAERDAERRLAIADKPVAPDPESPSELAREGMEKMLQALNKLVESVPQFEMPQVNENGDIILRRKRPETAPPPPPPAKVPDRSGEI